MTRHLKLHFHLHHHRKRLESVIVRIFESGACARQRIVSEPHILFSNMRTPRVREHMRATENVASWADARRKSKILPLPPKKTGHHRHTNSEKTTQKNKKTNVNEEACTQRKCPTARH